MTHTELKKLLKSHGIGTGLFDPGNLIFDSEFYIPTDAEFNQANKWAMEQLSWFVYSKKTDCDNFGGLWLGKMWEWISRYWDGKLPWSIGGVFGELNGEGHFWNYALTQSGLHHINYGQIIIPDTFKAKGSITA